MAGKRLLDTALVLAATRTIAKQHVRIRTEQVEHWSQTSSLAKAVKYQTDRVTVTASAAAALARRLNETPPEQYHTQSSGTSADDSVPRPDSVAPGTGGAGTIGLQQDHHYERAAQNATQEPVSPGQLDVRQEQATGVTTPDGSIPTRVAPNSTPDSDFYSERDLNKHHDIIPPSHNHTSADGSRPEASEVPSPASIPSHNAIPEQETANDINTDIFHSPKIAQMLTGRGKPTKEEYELRLRKARNTPIDDTPPALGHDQDTFNVRRGGSGSASGAGEHSLSKSQTGLAPHDQEDVHNLAAGLANDVQAAARVRRF